MTVSEKLQLIEINGRQAKTMPNIKTSFSHVKGFFSELP